MKSFHSLCLSLLPILWPQGRAGIPPRGPSPILPKLCTPAPLVSALHEDGLASRAACTLGTPMRQRPCPGLPELCGAAPPPLLSREGRCHAVPACTHRPRRRATASHIQRQQKLASTSAWRPRNMKRAGHMGGMYSSIWQIQDLPREHRTFLHWQSRDKQDQEGEGQGVCGSLQRGSRCGAWVHRWAARPY